MIRFFTLIVFLSLFLFSSVQLDSLGCLERLFHNMREGKFINLSWNIHRIVKYVKTVKMRS